MSESDRLAQLEDRVAALESLLMQRPIDPNYLYTPDEIAKWLRCGKSNVYGLMTRGELACTRIGSGNGGIRVRGSDINLFLEERTSGGPSPKTNFKYLAKYLNP